MQHSQTFFNDFSCSSSASTYFYFAQNRKFLFYWKVFNTYHFYTLWNLNDIFDAAACLL